MKHLLLAPLVVLACWLLTVVGFYCAASFDDDVTKGGAYLAAGAFIYGPAAAVIGVIAYVVWALRR